MELSIVIPIIRKEKAKRCIEAIEKDVKGSDHIVQVLSVEDIKGEGCPKMVKKLVAKAKYDLVMFLGDDTIPEPGFLDAAIEKMKEIEWGVVGLNTEDPHGSNPLAHWLAHKKILDYIPGGDFFSTEYKHCFGDNELKDIADEMGRWIFAEDSKIKHDHPVNEKAEWDEGYEKAYKNGAFEHDRKTYYKRKIARNREKYGTRLGIGWPLTDSMVRANFIYSFLAMNKPGYDFFVPHYPGRIDDVRNDIIKQALAAGVTHLWMTDTDQIYYDSETINKMMSHRTPIVSVPVMRRYPPFDPMLWRIIDGKKYEVSYEEIENAIENKKTLEINITGAGCILFDMEVFLNVDEPWFKSPEYGETGPGEDIYFWNNVFKAGYSILTDCSIKIEHLSVMGIGFETHQLFRKLKRRNES